jgi:endonuclease III
MARGKAISKSASTQTKGARAAARPKKPVRRARSRLSAAEIETLYARLQKKMPGPKGELGVNKATRWLFARVDTPQKMLALGEPKLIEAIRSLGFFNMKARNVLNLSRILVEEHGGEVPREREALERLPGVGRKTASVVLNTAFGVPAIAVDTHIFRVSNRTGLAPGATPDDVSDLLERITPEKFALHAHHWLILHGRYVCVARKPKCPECVIFDICRFKAKTEPAGALTQL